MDANLIIFQFQAQNIHERIHRHIKLLNKYLIIAGYRTAPSCPTHTVAYIGGVGHF